ncbi:hypothetical protein DFH94DRAFT_696199 [Russula ochroleuca]|uniref:CFEM domain-containing protein n=1 Tax=Russula ochroleuca TaxID=152965 RepID=A0A9P5MN12_9AGAM|nr:hypothetical protein DFH94DRAFT_696199 [Russula ochroleuca]
MLTSPRYLFALALVAAAGVSAQTTDACVLACVQEGLANSTCSSFTDLNCVCNSTSFKQTAANCLTANCTTADQQAALQLQQQECGTSSSVNSTASGSGSSSKSTSSTSPSASKSSSATAPIEQLPFLTAVIAIAGVALGGAFAL